MSEPRFFIDERGGCIAVRDRTLTDPEYLGLHEDTQGVVWYSHGKQIREKCKLCGTDHSRGWEITDEQRAEAQRQLEALTKSPASPAGE